MREWSIGIVGAGKITHAMHLPVLLNMPQVRVAWLADADTARATSVARAYGVPAVNLPRIAAELPSADVVLLAIPVGPRPAYYEDLAQRGVAVFAEKPFAVSAAEHARFAGLFGPAQVGCGYMRRMYESAVLIRQAIQEQWFGALRRLRIREGARTTGTGADRSAYDDLAASGGGALMTLGTHGIDLALHLAGARGFEVMESRIDWDGRMDRRVETRLRLDGVAADAGQTCELEFCVSWLDRQENIVEAEFEQARLRTGISSAAGVELIRRSGEPALMSVVPQQRGARTPNQAFYLEWAEFLRGLEAGQPSLMSAQSALLTAQAVEAIYQRGGGA